MVGYVGIFFDSDQEEIIHRMESNRLEEVNDIIHCTFEYRPSNIELYNEIIGKEVEIELLGYGFSKTNSGFLVRIPEDMEKYYNNRDIIGNLVIPHITGTISSNGKAKDTKYLNFVRFNKGIKVKGRFGYWIIENDKQYLSYEKYMDNNLNL